MDDIDQELYKGHSWKAFLAWLFTSNTEEEKEMKRRGSNGIPRIHFKNALVSPCDGPTEIDQPKLEPEIIRNIDGAAISHLIPDLNTVSPNAGWQASPQQVIQFYYRQIFTAWDNCPVAKYTFEMDRFAVYWKKWFFLQ